MHAGSTILLREDSHRIIRSLAAQHGFHDAEHRGELAQLFDGAGRRIRYLRPSGVSLDRFGELLVDRGVTSTRLGPAEVADLLAATFDSRPVGKAAKVPSAKAISVAERKARNMRSRKYVCPASGCGQIIRGTRNTVVDCGLCRELYGITVALVRVDPLPEEIAERAI